VATALGVAAFVCPRSFLAAFGAFLLVLAVTGFISASSLTMAVILPLVTAVLYRNNPGLLTFAVGITLVIAIRHAANIRRLSAGTEPRLGLWLKLFRRT
jgi:glycerol-3-phosphate acyltransferase PlsY